MGALTLEELLHGLGELGDGSQKRIVCGLGLSTFGVNGGLCRGVGDGAVCRQLLKLERLDDVPD